MVFGIVIEMFFCNCDKGFVSVLYYVLWVNVNLRFCCYLVVYY